MCGNHASDFRIIAYGPGSPPRVREPRPYLLRLSGTGRITPACAGTTRRVNRRQRENRDHPRVCGNHVIDMFHFDKTEGSPPRVREPPMSLPPLDVAEDHPRVCGNHFAFWMIWISPLGSPPRVREPLGMITADGIKSGITPACAGTTKHSVISSLLS